MAKLLWQAPGVHGVGIDVRINLGSGIKLQPDLVAYNAGYEELALIDYESPNSSDARVPWKDVQNVEPVHVNGAAPKVRYLTAYRFA